jgi:hypothetical protein
VYHGKPSADPSIISGHGVHSRNAVIEFISAFEEHMHSFDANIEDVDDSAN